MAEVVSSTAVGGPVVRGIEFEVDLDHSGADQLLFRVGGWLLAEDSSPLALLAQDNPDTSGPRTLAAKGTVYDRNLFVGGKYRVKVVALLSNEALAHVEHCRTTNKKNDVHLKLALQTEALLSHLQVSPFWHVERDDILPQNSQLAQRVGQPTKKTPLRIQTPRGVTVDLQIVAHGWDADYSNPQAYSLAADGGQPRVLSVAFQKPVLAWRIPAADWIHDYSPKLGLRERYLVEFPSPSGKLSKAPGFLKAAEDAMARWDTKSIFANCRELGVYLDKELQTALGPTSFAYKERWGRAYDRFGNRASLDLHYVQISATYPQDPTAVIDRRDCEGLFLSAKSLAKYAEELIG
jgi:hypothetical protein